MNNKLSLRSRFLSALILYTGIILALWVGYHNISYDTLNKLAKENTILAADNLIEHIGAEFSQMKTIVSVAAGSSYVQDFMKERDVTRYYEKADIAAEIIKSAAFSITDVDSITGINADGDYYRFTGDIRNAYCETLYRTFQGAGEVFTVVELEGALFFCYHTPVFDYSGASPVRLGNIIMITGLEKASRLLERGEDAMEIDAALISDGIVILSNNPAIVSQTADELGRQYGVVSTVPVSGTSLSVAAAIPAGALSPERSLFWIVAAILLFLLFVMIALLYRYLSSGMIKPMENIIANVREIGGGKKGRLPGTGRKDFDALVSDINDMIDRTERYNDELAEERQKLFVAELAKQKMRMGLLASQMDAHFVLNTLTGIKNLADRGENEKAAQMSEGLAALFKHQHAGDALVNVFVDFEILEQYIAIMNLKHNESFAVEYNVEDSLEACLMPRLILQPIVENAFAHGLGDKGRDARLTINGFMCEGAIRFEISDNGAGIPPAKLKSIQDSLTQTEMSDFPEPGLHGVALTNIQRQIRLRFGNEFGLFVQSDWGKGTTVSITLPLIFDGLE